MSQPPNAYRDDQDKAPLALLDPYALTQMAWVLGFGAQKYSAHNWRDGIEVSRHISSALRHLFALNAGEDTDPESGLPHAAHLACCAMMLCWSMAHRPDLDDRWATSQAGLAAVGIELNGGD
jgi:hypothetical protein